MMNPPIDRWGVCPTLHLGGLAIPAYGTFMLLAVLVATAVYLLAARRSPAEGRQGGYLVLAAIIGGTLGAKIPVWVMDFPRIVAALPDIRPILVGRTIVGGLLGGVLAVILMRRQLGITQPSGNLFAPAIALGIAIGRLGCFCGGCCYGTPTNLPWGVNFGDGIPRHPTQLYESLFALALFGFLLATRRRFARPGQLFGVLMIAYFGFRFLIEFLRAGDVTTLGLTAAQLASLGIMAYYIWGALRMTRSSHFHGGAA